jgi:hypothetical protein
MLSHPKEHAGPTSNTNRAQFPSQSSRFVDSCLEI